MCRRYRQQLFFSNDAKLLFKTISICKQKCNQDILQFDISYEIKLCLSFFPVNDNNDAQFFNQRADIMFSYKNWLTSRLLKFSELKFLH